MDNRKDLTTTAKQKITKLVSGKMSTLEISREICKYPRTTKSAVENITKLKTRNQEKGCKNLISQDEHQLKWVLAKQLLLTCANIFEKAEIFRVTVKKGAEYFGNKDLLKVSNAITSQ